MPISISVRLRHGRYDAGGDRPSDAEWPPHPARVFCALAAAADGDAAWAALRWLEAHPAPEIWADPAERVRTGRAGAYVVENAVDADGGNLSWPGRDNGMRTRAFAVPATALFAVVWPQADPRPGVLDQLRALARMVPYVGRSTSLAEVSVSPGVPGDPGGRVVYEAVPLGDPRGAWQIRVPYPGYADELQAAYLDGRRSWEVSRAVPYAVRQPRVVPADGDGHSSGRSAEGPFEDLMVWTLARPIARISGGQVVAIASALRKAVMSRIPDPVPAQVSGHGAPGRPHLGFLALPDAGHSHADGHVLGVALAIPRDFPPADLTLLIRAVIMDPGVDLHWNENPRLAADPASAAASSTGRSSRRRDLRRLYGEPSSSKSSSSSSRASGSRSCRVAAVPLTGPAGPTGVNEYFPWTLMCFLIKGLRRATSSSRTGYPWARSWFRAASI